MTSTRHPVMLYPTHEAAEEAIQAILACLPQVLTSIMMDEHQRWLDGGKPRPDADAFEPQFHAKLAELFAQHGGAIQLPNIALTREEIGLAIDGVAALVQSPDAEAAPLLKKLQRAYKAWA